MALKIICLVLALLLLSFMTINSIDLFINRKYKKNSISFKESLELVDLPVATFTNNGHEINLLLDTGSNVSQINSGVLHLLDHKMIDKSNTIMGIEGNKIETPYCEMAIKYKDKEFNNEFVIHDLSRAFESIKEETGVQIHGILGSQFFQKYDYIFDFKSLTAYSKK